MKEALFVPPCYPGGSAMIHFTSRRGIGSLFVMFAKATPEKALNFVRYTVSLAVYWPLKSNANKSQRVLHTCLQFLTFLVSVGVFLPLLYSVYINLIHNDLGLASNATLSMVATLHTIAQIGVSFFRHDHLQYLTEEMTTYFRNMKKHEREVYQRYVDKYSPFYVMAVIFNGLTVISVITMTMIMHAPFPLLTQYPFPVDYKPLWLILYGKQCYNIALCGCTLNSNTMAALLLFFAAGKFEILMITLQNATSIDDLRNCLEEYRAIRKFAEDVVYGVEYTVIATLFSGSVNVVCAGLNILGSVPLAQIIQHCVLVGTALLEVFMCALPADVLMEMSEGAIGSIYGARWYEQDIKAQKTVLQMLIPQKATVISLRFVMLAMSLEYFCTYVSNAFSMFTALRVLLEEPETVPKQSIISANYTCCNN